MKEIRDEGIKLKDGNREGRERESGAARERAREREEGVNRLEGGNQVMRSKDKNKVGRAKEQLEKK